MRRAQGGHRCGNGFFCLASPQYPPNPKFREIKLQTAICKRAHITRPIKQPDNLVMVNVIMDVVDLANLYRRIVIVSDRCQRVSESCVYMVAATGCFKFKRFHFFNLNLFLLSARSWGRLRPLSFFYDHDTVIPNGESLEVRRSYSDKISSSESFSSLMMCIFFTSE